VRNPRERRFLAVYLPLGVAAAIVADFAFLTALGGVSLPFTPICAGCPSPTTPLGTALALGTPTEQSAVGHDWYNFTVDDAGDGILLDEIQVQVLSAAGSVIDPSPDWTLVALGTVGALVGQYSLTDATWTTGGGAALESGQLLVLDTGSTTLADQGDLLNVIGVGAFGGTLTVSIP
jgi:hypothetical protein